PFVFMAVSSFLSPRDDRVPNAGWSGFKGPNLPSDCRPKRGGQLNICDKSPARCHTSVCDQLHTRLTRLDASKCVGLSSCFRVTPSARVLVLRGTANPSRGR